MKITVKVFAIIGIVLGSLAIIGSFSDNDFYTFVGGALFLAWGIVDLTFLKSLK